MKSVTNLLKFIVVLLKKIVFDGFVEDGEVGKFLLCDLEAYGEMRARVYDAVQAWIGFRRQDFPHIVFVPTEIFCQGLEIGFGMEGVQACFFVAVDGDGPWNLDVQESGTGFGGSSGFFVSAAGGFA